MIYAPNLSTIADSIREDADRAHAKYPQYAGLWDSADWRIVRIRRQIKTKLGLAFAKDEYALGRERTAQEIEHDDGGAFLVVYSVRNRCNTVIKARDAVWME